MLRCLSLTVLFALALTLTGCGSSSREIAPTKEAGTTISKEESIQKAMQGMPPDIQKQMMGKIQQKMKK